MEWKEYGYTGEFSAMKGDIIYRPMVAVKIKIGTQEHRCLALIDSGSDITMINADFADILGIDESKCPKVKVGGVEKSESVGFVARVKLQIEDFDKELETDVIFLKNMMVTALLGQRDFFEAFKIQFEKKHKKFYLAKEK
jgi:hypothetical protein